VRKSYHTIGKQGKANERKLAEFLSNNGQGMLPMVDLIEQCQMACDELIDVTGRAAIQAILQLSAAQVAGGPPQQGQRRGSDVVFYGCQPGQVTLSDRKVREYADHGRSGLNIAGREGLNTLMADGLWRFPLSVFPCCCQ
jgi:hypothetical protein